MKPMNDPAKDAYFEPARYASKLAALISEHQSKDERPDWWQQVVAELHGLLDKQFPPFYDCEECGAALYAAFATCEECGHKFNQGADVVPPWKGGSAPDELPDFFRLPEMAPTRMNLLDWRQNGFEQRLGDLEAHSLPVRMDTLEERLEAIAWWAGISYFHDESGKVFIPDALQARLVALESRADMQEQIDRLTARIDTIGDVLIKALQSIDALESKTPR